MVSQRARIVLDIVVDQSGLFRVPLLSKCVSISRAVAESLHAIDRNLEAATYVRR